jgi:PKD repeat protein
MKKAVLKNSAILIGMLIATESYSQFVVTTTKQNISCFALNNGSATANPSGGTPGYSFAWTPSGQSTQTATALSVGTHTVMVTDANGLIAIATTKIDEPPVLSINLSYVGPSCMATTGTATANASGGSYIYFYLWNNGQTTKTATGLSAGNYTVTVRDVNGCASTETITIAPLSMTASISANMTICAGWGGQMLTASGGNSYLWNTGATLISIEVDSSVTATYSVIVSAGTCKDTLAATVVVIAPPIPGFSSSNSCLGTPTRFTDESTSSVPLDNWYWNFGDGLAGSSNQNPSHAYANSGTYTVSLFVTNHFGCKDTAIQTVVVMPIPIANFISTNICVNTPIQFTDLSTIVLGSITRWHWNFGDPTQMHLTVQVYKTQVTFFPLRIILMYSLP